MEGCNSFGDYYLVHPREFMERAREASSTYRTRTMRNSQNIFVLEQKPASVEAGFLFSKETFKPVEK